MIWPWSATRRHIEWLEAEIHLLRQQVFRNYQPPRQQKKREHDPPPASLVQLCATFERAGPRLLQEAIQKHARGVSFEDIEAEIRGHIQAHSNGGGV